MSLRRADEHISDGLQIAMVVKGLPDSYKPFVVHITQTNDIVTFSEFKTKLQSYESTEKYGKSDMNVEEDNVMKTSGAMRSQGRGRGRKMDLANVEYYACGKKEHLARTCPDKYQTRREERKRDTPQRGRGRSRGRGPDHVKKADGETETEPTSFCVFKLRTVQIPKWKCMVGCITLAQLNMKMLMKCIVVMTFKCGIGYLFIVILRKLQN